MKTTQRMVTLFSAAVVLFSGVLPEAQAARDKPAPPPSRYGYYLKFDLKSLPKGVKIRSVNRGRVKSDFISNESDVPLIVNQRFQDGKLVTGAKLVSGKVYHYFPNGVPMEGKTHLKGWQAPFGEIKETIIDLPREPAKIYEGRKPGLSKTLPAPEPFSISAEYNGQPYSLKGTIHYDLNPAYDTPRP